jgi:hypothetical protein
MAINQNHLFEELNGVKCAIVEKNVAGERVDFLRRILEYNRYTVVVVPSPPPKAVPAAAATAGAAAAPGVPATAGTVPGAPATVPGGAAGAEGPGPADTAAPTPETFTVGVTDVMFNAVNAVFGRLLKTPGGHIVTLAYWQQQEKESDDEKPYFDGR